MQMIEQIEQNIKRVLLDEADKLGRESGLIQRQRVLTGSLFAHILVWGVLDKPEMSYTDMSQDMALFGAPMSAQGLAQRFGPAAARFLLLLLERTVERVVEGVASRSIAVLERFHGVYLRDSTTIPLPKALEGTWPGCGGSAGETAALKVQVRLDYSTGRLEGPALQAGRQHDRATPFGPESEAAGSLSLADLGYFSLVEWAERDRRGQFFLTRYKVGTALYTPDGQRLDLVSSLSHVTEDKIERVVEVGVQTRLRMRLLAYRVSQEVAEQRRRRLREYARKKQRTPTKESLFLAGWVLMLTNVPTELLTIEEALVVGRVRWQVEILFRMWKSHMCVDKWRSENPWRILSETYAKFIALTILHWVLLLEWGRHFDLSLIKAAQAVQKVALSLGLALFEQGNFEQPLRRLLRALQVACRQNKRRTKPATFQLLLALESTLS